MSTKERKPIFNRPFNLKTFKPQSNLDEKDPNAPMTRLLDRYSSAEMLLNTTINHYIVNKQPFSDDVIQMAKQNYIVSLISELEIFFKNIINSYVWSNENGYKELLESENINLYDAYIAFSGIGVVTRENIIAEHFSFSSIPQVEKVFNRLTGKKFLNEVERANSFIGPDGVTTLVNQLNKSGIKDWREILSKAYANRHVIVHQGLDGQLDITQTRHLGTIIFYFGMASTFYLNGSQTKK